MQNYYLWHKRLRKLSPIISQSNAGQSLKDTKDYCTMMIIGHD